jgi:putative membrane protein
MHRCRLATTLALMGLFALGPAQAQRQAGQDSGGDSPGGKDQQFLNYAAEDNQAEIQVCLLAEKRAVNPALKAFARLMVNDHVQIESRLAALGNELHASLSDGIGKEGQETRSKMAQLTGDAFESAFMQTQIKDHSEDIEKFSNEMHSSENTRIKQFATETVPILQQHLALARAVQAQLGSKTVGKSDK